MGGGILHLETRACLRRFFLQFPLPSRHVTHSSQLQVEPRKILETRKRFLEEKFGSSQKAEAEVQKLLVALLQVRAFVESSVETRNPF
jgi:hypothetical protein